MTTPCGCRARKAIGKTDRMGRQIYKVAHCPLHKAAPLLHEAAKRALDEVRPLFDEGARIDKLFDYDGSRPLYPLERQLKAALTAAGEGGKKP